MNNLFISWSGFVFGLIGAILGLLGYFNSQNASKIVNTLKADQALNQAWDILGDVQGSGAITDAVEDKNKRELARRLIDEALLVAPTYSKSHLMKGIYYNIVGIPNRAEEELRQAISLDDKNGMAHFNLGTLLYSQGKIDSAIVSYHAAIELEPYDYYIHFKLGEALFAKGEMKSAELALRDSLKFNPDFSSSQNLLKKL